MCENAYLSIKNPKVSRALKWALDPGRRMLASLAWLCFATSATFGLRSWGPPLDQILDPHLGQLRLYFSLLPLRFMRNELTQPAAAYQYHFVNNANLTCNWAVSWWPAPSMSLLSFDWISREHVCYQRVNSRVIGVVNSLFCGRYVCNIFPWDNS